ncbi:TetR/AcrR family transcriptional regulator [Chloroflexota bacterium]
MLLKYNAAEHKTPRQGKRDAIMDAAIEVFGRSGLDGANVDEIARTAGVAKGTIYLYFKSKHDIFEAVLAERWPGPFLDSLLPDMASVPELYDLPIETALMELGIGFLEAVEDNLIVFRLALGEAYRYPDRAEHIFESTFLKANRMVAGYLENQAKAGIIAPLTNPLITARCLQGMLMTYILSQELLNGKKFIHIEKREWVREVVRLFLRGVEVSDSSGRPHRERTGNI